MSSPPTTAKFVEEDCLVDRDIKRYLSERSRPLTAEEAAAENTLAGKCVARSKADARIVAWADDYESLATVLAEKKIDPQTVVRSFVDDPNVDVIHWGP